MRKILLSFLIVCFMATTCFAGIVVVYDQDGEVTSIYKGGQVDGALYYHNNMNEWNDIVTLKSLPKRYLKVVAGELVEKTQQEKDDTDAAIAQAASDAAIASEIARITAFDDSLDAAAIGDATLTKVDAKIDAISDLADAKTFLKKLARYLLND